MRFWDLVVDSLKEVGCVEKVLFVLGGRITLILSCLSYIHSYFLSLFMIPTSIVLKIEKMQRDFLWLGSGEGKKDHLIKWDVVCRPKEFGGLWIGKTSLRNRALLGK